MKFDTTREELDAVIAICERAEKRGLVSKSDRMAAVMDLTATHASGNPMDFQRMLEADDANFAHDYFGIRRHINRETGKLEDFFAPRFSKREPEAA